MALLNNLIQDFDLMLHESGMKLKEVATAVGRDPSNLRATVRSQVINSRYIEAVDTMGYDIKIIHIKKENKK